MKAHQNPESSPKLLLQVAPIPKPLHRINLRSVLKSGWGMIRRTALEEAGYKCETCGEKANKGLHAHEDWKYDTTSDPAVASISRIVIQCPKCHDCEHFFRILMIVKDGAIPADTVRDLVEHFCRVNGVGVEDFNRHAVAVWNESVCLSGFHWQVDLRPYSDKEVHADPTTGLNFLKRGSRLPWIDPHDDDRRGEFMYLLTEISTRYGYWIGSPLSSVKLPLHVLEPGKSAGHYSIARILEPGDEAMTIRHTLSYARSFLESPA